MMSENQGRKNRFIVSFAASTKVEKVWRSSERQINQITDNEKFGSRKEHDIYILNARA